MDPTIAALKEYVQTNYGGDGVEVTSQGKRSITLELPIEFHDIGELCAAVEDLWDARVDVMAATKAGLGPSLDIWLPINTMPDRTSSQAHSSVWSTAAGAAGAVLAAAVALHAGLLPGAQSNSSSQTLGQQWSQWWTRPGA